MTSPITSPVRAEARRVENQQLKVQQQLRGDLEAMQGVVRMNVADMEKIGVESLPKDLAHLNDWFKSHGDDALSVKDAAEEEVTELTRQLEEMLGESKEQCVRLGDHKFAIKVSVWRHPIMVHQLPD